MQFPPQQATTPTKPTDNGASSTTENVGNLTPTKDETSTTATTPVAPPHPMQAQFASPYGRVPVQQPGFPSGMPVQVCTYTYMLHNVCCIISPHLSYKRNLLA